MKKERRWGVQAWNKQNQKSEVLFYSVRTTYKTGRQSQLGSALLALVHYFTFTSSVQYLVTEVKLYSVSTSMQFQCCLQCHCLTMGTYYSRVKGSIKGRWKKMEIQHRLGKSVNKLQKLSICLPFLILLSYSNYWACNWISQLYLRK